MIEVISFDGGSEQIGADVEGCCECANCSCKSCSSNVKATCETGEFGCELSTSQ